MKFSSLAALELQYKYWRILFQSKGISVWVGHLQCLTAPSHYLNQCWLIVNETPRNTSKQILMIIWRCRHKMHLEGLFLICQKSCLMFDELQFKMLHTGFFIYTTYNMQKASFITINSFPVLVCFDIYLCSQPVPSPHNLIPSLTPAMHVTIKFRAHNPNLEKIQATLTWQ